MDADVAIVGSGVAGALLGWRLASAGARVLLLEAGGPVDRARALARFQASPDRALDSPYPESARVGAPSAGDLARHYVQEGPDFLSGLYLRLVGGTTWHWLGTALRMLPEDFGLRSRHGVGEDWPLGYGDLEPWYGRAEDALGVAGDSGNDLGSPRSSPYPMPPHRPARVDGVVGAAAARLGWTVDPLPQARNSRPWEGRPACCGAASCTPLCPIGAKYDASVHVRRAVAAGAELRTGAVVHRLGVGAGGRIERVCWTGPSGPGEARAGVVVVAAHAVETPRLLLASRNPRNPSGVANSSGLVGRCLMAGNAVLSQALAPVRVDPYGAPQATSGMLGFREGPFRSGRSGFLLAIATDGWADGAPDRLAPRLIRRGLRGKALRAALEEHVRRQVALASTCEDLPDPENRIELAEDHPDAFGIPRPRIRYRIPDWTRAGQAAARAVHEQLFEALGAQERGHATAADPGYLLGTCRMGTEPATSVVTSDLRAHDHPNLYLLGSMVFPTAGSAPPTLTVAALALRLAGLLGA